VQPIPAGYHAVTAYLAVQNATQALDYYKRAFGAKELGDSHVMLADESPSMGFLGPQSRGGTTVQLHLYVTAAGGKVTRPVEDKFYGDRAGTLDDPFGHTWYVARRKEDAAAEGNEAPHGRDVEEGGERRLRIESRHADFRIRLPRLRPRVRDAGAWRRDAGVRALREQRARQKALALRGAIERRSRSAGRLRHLRAPRRSRIVRA
jgi:PhnB protein